MKDIAKLAGVSIKTVSRVVNNNSEVKLETRDKVLDIIRKENYQVNILAKGLRDQNTRTIMIFIDKHKGGYWNAWHTEIMQNIMSYAKEIGYKIVISSSSAYGFIDDDTDGFLLLKHGLADGAVIFDNKKDDVRIEYLRKNKLPYVIIGKVLESNYNYVDLNNEKAGYMGLMHLKEKGYKDIKFLLSNEEFIVNQERANGFKKACLESKINCDIIFGILNIELAYKKTIELIEVGNLDAIFISGDERAFGVYKAIKERNLRIPEDIAVLSIDNIKYSNYITPPLTTISQEIDIFSKEVVDMLVDIIKSKNNRVKSKMIEPKIIIRKST
jgi:LacI family transcriptional regulator